MRTTFVGQYSQPLGFHDMHGNVPEWTQYDDYPSSAVTDPGVGIELVRVLRGGSWHRRDDLRSKRSLSSRIRFDALGFVLVSFQASKPRMWR